MTEGGWVLRTLVALAGVSALAWVLLAFVARRGSALPRWLQPARAEPSRLRVLERVALSARQELFLVQADARVFLLGSNATGALELLTELERESLPRSAADVTRVN